MGFHLAAVGLFPTPRNLRDLVVRTVVSLMVIGMARVIALCHIELSARSAAGLVSMVFAVVQIRAFPSGAARNW